MHELGITQEVINIVTKHADGRKIRRIVLEIGKLSAILPDAVRFCFDLCSEGTPAEGAELTIDEIPGEGRCRECGQVFPISTFWDECSCGNVNMEWSGGDELRVKEMELVVN